jgi:hypothetical protein
MAGKELTNQQTIAWLVEAALRYQGRPMALATLQSTSVLFPFFLNQPLAYVISKSDALELWSEGSSQQFVAMRVST